MNPEIKKNVLSQIHRTLGCLSSEADQVRYKKNVSFVHVPIELLAQWDSYREHFSRWLNHEMSGECLASWAKLDKLILEFERHKEIADVPEIFSDENWRLIGRHALALLNILATERGQL